VGVPELADVVAAGGAVVVDLGPGVLDQWINAVAEAIKAIEAAKDHPELRSITPVQSQGGLGEVVQQQSKGLKTEPGKVTWKHCFQRQRDGTRRFDVRQRA
jgi:hypothetical protein